jgi:hypothetical protein
VPNGRHGDRQGRFGKDFSWLSKPNKARCFCGPVRRDEAGAGRLQLRRNAVGNGCPKWLVGNRLGRQKPAGDRCGKGRNLLNLTPANTPQKHGFFGEKPAVLGVGEELLAGGRFGADGCPEINGGSCPVLSVLRGRKGLAFGSLPRLLSGTG